MRVGPVKPFPYIHGAIFVNQSDIPNPETHCEVVIKLLEALTWGH